MVLGPEAIADHVESPGRSARRAGRRSGRHRRVAGAEPLGGRGAASGPAGASARSPHRCTTWPGRADVAALLSRLDPAVVIDLDTVSSMVEHGARIDEPAATADDLAARPAYQWIERRAEGRAAHARHPRLEGPVDDRGPRPHARRHGSHARSSGPHLRSAERGDRGRCGRHESRAHGALEPGAGPRPDRATSRHVHDRTTDLLRVPPRLAGVLVRAGRLVCGSSRVAEQGSLRRSSPRRPRCSERS